MGEYGLLFSGTAQHSGILISQTRTNFCFHWMYLKIILSPISRTSHLFFKPKNIFISFGCLRNQDSTVHIYYLEARLHFQWQNITIERYQLQGIFINIYEWNIALLSQKDKIQLKSKLYHWGLVKHLLLWHVRRIHHATDLWYEEFRLEKVLKRPCRWLTIRWT